ncbi:hypothetical protein PJKIFABJ_00002 [Pseudomonas phage PE09]|uniref:Uncharacterized protein n=2 Tax=Otagovirus TaxID=2560197 RepID=A0A7S8BC17_9CAUD|nr:hypothetical protein QGX22_gp002 [Pseudomonas phage PE09]YP_010768310.1 hypothetical protein QGX23_gp002 [Pseudomonas phage PN09]QHZ59957.1 hypothetical protein PJKIFABJ_00002 [Pseudomonas phage PE09]QPB10423.1 hypothetical protein PN09_002 [Pseudomonas phage PN09]
MSWQEQIAMMSPKEERAYWLDDMKRRAEAGYGMAVNCRHGPSLERTPVLRKLVEDGILLRVRENRQWGTHSRKSRSRRTILIYPLVAE